MIEVARLRGRDVDLLLLDMDRGFDERCVRLMDLVRRGLRGMDSRRLSGRSDRGRWWCDLERRCGVGTEGGNSTGGGGWLGVGG